MSVSYDRSRFFSFALMGSETHLKPVVARVLELDLPEDVLLYADPVTYEQAEELQGDALGDVNVSSIVAVAESLPSLPFPSSADDMADEQKADVARRCAKSAAILNDVLAMVQIANRRFRKSKSWPLAAVDDFLAKIS